MLKSDESIKLTILRRWFCFRHRLYKVPEFVLHCSSIVVNLSYSLMRRMLEDFQFSIDSS